MKSIFTVMAVTLTASVMAFAGDNGGGQITCKSGSGRTVLAGGAGTSINGTGNAMVDLTVDNKTVKLGALDLGVQQKQNGNVITDAVVADLGKKIYALTFIELNTKSSRPFADKILQLVSVPSTMTNKGGIVKFKATLTALDPRQEESGEYLQNVDMNCVLDVTI